MEDSASSRTRPRPLLIAQHPQFCPAKSTLWFRPPQGRSEPHNWAAVRLISSNLQPIRQFVIDAGAYAFRNGHVNLNPRYTRRIRQALAYRIATRPIFLGPSAKSTSNLNRRQMAPSQLPRKELSLQRACPTICKVLPYNACLPRRTDRF